MSFFDFINTVTGSGAMIFSSLLICGVIFVNGWTDAPNAICASVSTGAMSMRQAVPLAAVFNFLGAAVMGALNTSVASSMGEITMLIGDDGGEGRIAVLCAALSSIIIWAVIAWIFGIPTSESHALISGIVGAALAFGIKVNDASRHALVLAALGLILSLPAGGVFGYISGKISEKMFKSRDEEERRRKFHNCQKVGAAAMAFMHGAQDSQKFAGVMMAAIVMAGGREESGAPGAWLTLAVSVIIAAGTCAGGYRIIKKVGMQTVNLTAQKGFAADISGALCMLIASIGGIPVSTTHTATASIIGAGISSPPRKLDLGSLREMILAWLLTFPCCGMLAYGMVKLLLIL